MTFYSVDIEADGPAPGLFSMLSIGVVAVRPGLTDRFYRELQPISDRWRPEALEICQLDRDRLSAEGAAPAAAMADLYSFLSDTSVGDPIFISDNPGFDFGFVNYYFHAFVPEGNPFGYSSRRIGDLWAGMTGDASTSSDWKSLAETAHTHNALDDAVGNGEALLKIQGRGLEIDLS
jgi:DNA polymerase III epsilon subunit-like protein